MANDYGTILPDVQAAANVISAPGKSSSGSIMLDGLAKGLGSLTNLWEGHVQAKKQAAQQARQAVLDQRATTEFNQQQTDRQEKQQGNAIEGDLTMSLFQINNGQWENNGWVGKPEGPPVEQPPSPEIVAAVDKAGAKLDNTRAAVDQGKMPAISAEAQINQSFQFLVNKYGDDPQTISQIAASFDKRGIKNALIQSYLDERAVADKTVDNKLAFENKMIEYGITHGTPGEVLASMTREEQVAQGIKLAQKDNNLQALQQQATLNSTLNSTNIQSYEFQQKQNDQEFSSQATGAIMTAMSPTVKGLQQLLNNMGEAGSKPVEEARYGALLSKARQQHANLISQYIQKAGIKDIAKAEAIRSSLTRDFEAQVIQPYETRNKAHTSALTAIQDKFKVDLEIAAPMLQGARRMGYSSETLQAAIGTLDPGTASAIAAEVKGLKKDPFAPSATIHLTNILGVLEGQMNLNSNMSPTERAKVIGSTYNYVNSNVKGVVNGTSDGMKWINSARQMVIATNGLNAQSPLKDLRGVAYAMFDTDAINAVTKLRNGETKEEATLLGHGMRASAGVTLSALQTQLRGTKQEGWTVGTTSDGHWVAMPDKNWKPRAVYSRSDGFGGSIEQTARPALSGNTKSAIEAANMTLGFLVSTNGWDSDAPKGTAKEVRRMWSRGEPTSAMRTSSQKAAATPSLGKQFDILEAQLDKAPELIDTGFSGDNSDIIGPEGTGKNPRSSAQGVGQFVDGTFISVLKNHAPELVQGKSDSEILRMRGNKLLESKMVGWYREENGKKLSAAGIPATPANTALAHFAGPAGATKLLKADPNAPVSQVLGQAAIEANPHLRGKTAAEAIAWARKFYA